MQLSIASVLSDEEVSDVLLKLGQIDFAPGRDTAGWAARGVKRNEQALPGMETEDLVHGVCEQLLCNELFQLAARPKRIVKAMVSRYRPGDSYGWHVDNAVMDGGRTDLSSKLCFGMAGLLHWKSKRVALSRAPKRWASPSLSDFAK